MPTSGALVALAVVACAAVVCLAGPLPAQTIEGQILDTETGLPVPLGLVMMFTESGDSVTSAVANEMGRFQVTSSEPGSFLLLAAALGYEETPAGVFELGEDARMTVEYGLRPQPLPIDAVVVSLDQPAAMHQLVRNGFVRRLQRGLGAFLTPYDIERSSARSTEQLLAAVPGVQVRSVFAELSDGAGTAMFPRPDIGEAVHIRSNQGGWCQPTIYVNGARVPYSPDTGLTLSMMTDRSSIDAIEVYRRPAEIPVEYAPRRQGDCGVLVLWTKTGRAPGQSASGRADGVEVAEDGGLPRVDERGPAPEPGERIRVDLEPEAVERLGITSPWGGTFVSVQDTSLVATDPTWGRALALPLDGIESLQVLRPRSPERAWVRGAVAGGAMGLGTWLGLSLLCGWSQCDGTVTHMWLPAAGSALFVGFLVQRMGPGDHWVAAPLPRLP